MGIQKSKARRSLLTSFADESEKYNDGSKDYKKLVDKALNADPEIRKALISGLVDLAIIDEKFRRQIKDKFEVIGVGKRSRLPMDYSEKIMLVSSVEVLRKEMKKQKKPSSVTDVCELISHIFERSPKYVETLYYRLKKDPNVLKSLI